MKPPSSSGLGLRPLTAPTPVQIRSGVQRRNGSKSREACQLGYGVIGNTGDSGSSILGSSPGTPANNPRILRGFFCISKTKDIAYIARTFLVCYICIACEAFVTFFTDFRYILYH